ncbi:hypothetical protein BDF14DRAFT_1767567 [Spinellus fusiger]|nr:hypothetical protein BDF14DRAFT_1767567 [Spinellus fusiger]
MAFHQPVHSVLFDNSAPLDTTGNAYYSTPPAPPAGANDNLQFYSSSYDEQYSSSYYNTNAPPPPAGDIQSGHYDYSRNSHSIWSALGTGGFADEPPLLEELGINFEHIKTKSMTVLNPFGRVPDTIMDDADLAGPLLFLLLFGMFLLFSGKAHFGYIYGVGVLGVVSIYLILNLMSESGVDWTRTASVLGYCLLPMVMLSGFSVVITLGTVVGAVLSVLSILWCTYSSSGMFTSVLHMSEQRYLVAYPVGLFYASFALMTVF